MIYSNDILRINDNELFQLLKLLNDWNLVGTSLYYELSDVFNLRDGRYHYLIVNWKNGNVKFSNIEVK